MFKDTPGGKTAEEKRKEYNAGDAKLWNIHND
jgi:hypothetical protein